MTRGRLSLISRSVVETEAIGTRLVRMLPRGTVVALRGELASGKTCLVRGMAAAVMQIAPVHSPTFTLVNQYESDPPLYHMDLYRLSDPREMADLGYDELFDSEGICIVEWAERAEDLLPNARLDVALEHAGGDVRRLTFEERGRFMPDDWRERLVGDH